MRLGDVANAQAASWGRPLDGVRVLALEQMQSLPFATEMLTRLGADVVKVEHPRTGESGRAAQPATPDRAGRPAGTTFLRYNLGKRSIGIDVKQPRGRELVLRLAPRFDVICENFRAGAMERAGLGWSDLHAIDPRLIYLSVSGFGHGGSPYVDWPAYAGIAEAMSGVYEYSRRPHQPPIINPVGGLGDTAAGLFATIGVLAALRHRERTGQGQYIDISMFDCMVSMADIVTNFWSMGMEKQADEPLALPHILEGFRAADGWFMVQVLREHQFERLAQVIGREDWLAPGRFPTRWDWARELESEIRPAIEGWAATLTKFEASGRMAAAGVTAAPCTDQGEVVADPHVALRNMLVEIPRLDGVDRPVLAPGNPVKMSLVAEGPEGPFPYLGEHTDDVLATELGLTPAELAHLRGDGVIGGDTVQAHASTGPED
jgi:crotonobetainyl-CoA:carnitine CoA-transferase CaiB-like acyl-CoA transferase